MRDGAAVRALARGAFDVDVDSLVVAGAMREFVDPLLVHADPLRHTELTPDELVYRGKTKRLAKRDYLAGT